MRLYLVYLCIGLFAASCSLAEEDTRTAAYTLPVQYVVSPENVTIGDTARFSVSYRRPSDCYIFNGFNTEEMNYSRIISINAIYFNSSACQEDQETIYEVPMEFVPVSTGTYEFKFWSGDNAQNEHEYIIRTLTVENTN